MKKITVIFSESMTDSEISQAENAIRMIRGVVGIDGGYSHTSGGSESSRPFVHEPSFQEDRSYSQAQQMPRMESGGGGQQFPEALPEGKQRQFINEVIRWAVKNGKLSIQELQKLSPEDIVKVAMSLSDQMSDEEKTILARQIEQ